jgi:hypothetical protein
VARRKPATWNIQKEIRDVKNRPSAKYRKAQFDPDVPAESDVASLQESERFMFEQGRGDFIPFTYDPTKTSWPANGHDHRRTVAAGYDRNQGIIKVKFFTDGAEYYYGTDSPIPPYVAFQFRQTQSPGRFINSTLESYGYERIN